MEGVAGDQWPLVIGRRGNDEEWENEHDKAERYLFCERDPGEDIPEFYAPVEELFTPEETNPLMKEMFQSIRGSLKWSSGMWRLPRCPLQSIQFPHAFPLSL
jgi:hypothetical protein